MKIETWVSGMPASALIRDLAEDALCVAMEDMQLPSTAIEQVIVADDANYSAAIHHITGNNAYTSHAGLLGIGKCVSTVTSDGDVLSNIVLHANLIGALYGRYEKQSTGETTTGEHDAVVYGLFHELGHCVDDRRRKQHLGVSYLGYSKLDESLRRLAQSILSEYSACKFTSHFLSDGGREYLRNELPQNLEAIRDEIDQLKLNYRCGNSDLDELFWKGIGYISTILNQFARVQGLHHPHLVSFEGEMIYDVLNSFSGDLRKAWDVYPSEDCEKAALTTTQSAFNAFSFEMGLCYETTEEGDAVWLI